MIALIIKGSPLDARAELLKRGIVPNDSFVSMAKGRETLGRCSSEALAKVQSWLAETALPPFPVGTLLFYKVLDSDAADRESLEASAKHQPQSQEELLP